MRRVLKLVCLAALLVVPAGTASAQAVCSIIAKYFVNAPSGFISERGQQLGPRRWRSNLSFPHASCYIRVSEDGNDHRIHCVLNEGETADEAVQFYKDTEEAIESCLEQIPVGDEYEKSIDKDSDADSKWVTTTWERDADDADYIIEVGGVFENDGSVHNTMSIEFDNKE